MSQILSMGTLVDTSSVPQAKHVQAAVWEHCEDTAVITLARPLKGFFFNRKRFIQKEIFAREFIR